MPALPPQSYVQTTEPCPTDQPATARRRGGWVVVAKLGITLLTLGLLWHSVVDNEATAAAWQGLLARSLGGAGRGPVLLALLLMPFNWGLEAWKWWRLARHLEPVSFRRSFRAVLVGLTLGFVTPNRMGDYAGRIMELKSRRLDALGAVFLGRYCQLVATVLAGTLGLLYFGLRFYLAGYPAAQIGLVVLALVINLGVLLPLYYSGLLVAAVRAVRPLRRFSRYLAVMPTYPARLLTDVLLISGLRYLVFGAQFGLLLLAYGVQAPMGPAAAAVAGTFLLKSLVPSLNALADVGVRELSATHLFGLLGQPALPVLSASLSLWVLNIAVPSAIGLFFVLRLKVRLQRRVAPATGDDATHPPA